jgi:hypothetical protein
MLGARFHAVKLALAPKSLLAGAMASGWIAREGRKLSGKSGIPLRENSRTGQWSHPTGSAFERKIVNFGDLGHVKSVCVAKIA